MKELKSTIEKLLGSVNLLVTQVSANVENRALTSNQKLIDFDLADSFTKDSLKKNLNSVCTLREMCSVFSDLGDQILDNILALELADLKNDYIYTQLRQTEKFKGLHVDSMSYEPRNKCGHHCGDIVVSGMPMTFDVVVGDCGETPFETQSREYIGRIDNLLICDETGDRKVTFDRKVGFTDNDEDPKLIFGAIKVFQEFN